jgi:hypothetical protein
MHKLQNELESFASLSEFPDPGATGNSGPGPSSSNFPMTGGTTVVTQGGLTELSGETTMHSHEGSSENSFCDKLCREPFSYLGFHRTGRNMGS